MFTQAKILPFLAHQLCSSGYNLIALVPICIQLFFHVLSLFNLYGQFCLSSMSSPLSCDKQTASLHGRRLRWRGCDWPSPS